MIDIRALHDIVAAAQEALDQAPDPKPLPAAALFRAYDEVLPRYGIDPDDDHHLSALVFRVGGEQGEGTLVDKFQTILGRMGIVLEFGDNTTVSFRTSPSNSPAFSSSSRRGHPNHDTKTDDPSPEVEVPKSPSQPNHITHEDYNMGDAISEPDVDDEEEDAEEEMMLSARRAAMSSAMNRWRSLVAKRQDDQNPPRAPLPTVREESTLPTATTNLEVINTRRPETRAQPVVEPEIEDMRNQTGLTTQQTLDRHPPSLPSLTDRWRTLAMNVQKARSGRVQQESADILSLQHPPVPEMHEEVPQVESDDETAKDVLPTSFPVKAANAVPQRTVPTQSRHQGPQILARPHQEGELVNRDQPAFETPRPSQTEAESEAKYQRNLRRAARAREIYLASKFFNRWADRTARRLERDAVARRHMIRFRCFRGWLGAHPSREPVAENLRAATSIKKWQRNIAEQETILKATAEAAAWAYQLKRARKVFDQWCYRRLEDVAQCQAASRMRSKVLSGWMTQKTAHATLHETIRTQKATRDATNALQKWHTQAERAEVRAAAAQRIGAVQQSFSHLREWWDRAEIDRRAKTYRRHLYLEKAGFAFTQWNLQARAQAFVWKREYHIVTRVFERWWQDVQQHQTAQRNADRLYADRAKIRVLGCMEWQQTELVQLTRLESRARLYIGATRVLSVFDRVVKQRKTREKDRVKQYLKARYTEMSSRRKKRNFFWALDHWRAVAAADQTRRRLAADLRERQRTEKLMIAVETWSGEAADSQEQLESAQLFHGQKWLDLWSDYAHELEQRELEAVDLLAADKQHHYVKQWSISTMQHSGQAHTATKVQTKHEREKRNRVLQNWRRSCEQSRGRVPEPGSQMAPSTFPQSVQSVQRASWRGVNARRSLARRNEENQDFPLGAFETPTRWTGQPLPVSALATGSMMAPLREADEDDDGDSLMADDDMELHTTPTPPRFQLQRDQRPLNLSTTTPRAPVPSHLRRNSRMQLGGPSRLAGGSQGTPNVMFPPTRTEPLDLGQPGGPARRTTVAPGSDRRPPNPLTQSGRVSRRSPRGLIGSKSVGARPAGSRFATPQAAGPSTTRRSVRIRSPDPSQLSRRDGNASFRGRQ